MRRIVFALIAASAHHADTLSAQYSITATAEVKHAYVTTPARVQITAASGVLRIEAVGGVASARDMLVQTYVTAAARDTPRTIWIADGPGLRQQQCDTAALELQLLLRQRAIELPRDDDRRIIVTKVVASDS